MNKEVQVYFDSTMNVGTDYTQMNYDLVKTIAYSLVYLVYHSSTHTVTLNKPSGYNPDAMIAYAHARGVKVVLSFQCNTDTDAAFIADSTARISAVNALLAEVQSHNFDGIDNDIENHVLQANMTSFHTLLADTFWMSNSNYRISIAVARGSSDMPDNRWDMSALANKFNYAMVMGYDTFDGSSSQAGPNAPIDSENIYWTTIRRSIDYWLTAPGKAVDPNKLLLGVPYYGHEWPTVGDTRLANTTGTGTYILYQSLIDKASKYGRMWDTTWQTPWYAYQSGGQWHEGHYDDVQSLGIKYDLVNSKGLAGIGIWAINYAYNAELWQLIQDKFVTIPTLGEIQIVPTSANINIGTTKQISATCKDQNNNVMICPNLIWSSSDTSVVTVDADGLVKGIRTGKANVTVSYGTIVSNLSIITVTVPTVLSSIQISLSIKIGVAKQLTAKCLDQNKNIILCPSLNWTSSNTSVASVSPTGIVKGIATGTAIITASVSGIISNIFIITVT